MVTIFYINKMLYFEVVLPSIINTWFSLVGS